jgi:hypothetical protein
MKTNINLSIAKKSVLVLIITFFTVVSAAALAPVTAENQFSVAPLHATSIEYQSIKVTITDKSVILDWNTASELPSNYFEVERSSDMNEFKTVALVLDGFTNGSTGKRYAFKENVSVAKNGNVAYYRLKQFDANGNISYSSVVKAQQSPSAN